MNVRDQSSAKEIVSFCSKYIYLNKIYIQSYRDEVSIDMTIRVDDIDFKLPLRKWVMVIVQDDQFGSSGYLIYHRVEVEGKGEHRVSSRTDER